MATTRHQRFDEEDEEDEEQGFELSSSSILRKERHVGSGSCEELTKAIDYQPMRAEELGGVPVEDGAGEGRWQSSLCDCCQDGCTCAAACCCVPCTTAQLAVKMGVTKCPCTALAIVLIIVAVVGEVLRELLFAVSMSMRKCVSHGGYETQNM